jgi:hypothetical protein
VSPSTGLKASQTVQVSASGFSPNESLVITECASKGNATTSGDCNVGGITATKSNANGQVQASMTVVKGPFGSNHIVCSASQACLVSVSQATLSPTQEADAPISFG